MFVRLAEIKRGIHHKRNVNHFIKDAKSYRPFGESLYDHYFEKHKIEMLRAFTQASDLTKLAKINQYAATKLISHDLTIIDRLATNNDNYVMLFNMLYELNITHNALESLPPKLTFTNFLKLDRPLQWALITMHGTLIASLFTSVNDIIKFSTLDNEIFYSTDSQHCMLSLIENYSNQLMPLFQSAHDIIRLAHCKYNNAEISIAYTFVKNNLNAVSDLFKNNLSLYKKLDHTDKVICRLLTEYQDQLVKQVAYHPTLFSDQKIGETSITVTNDTKHNQSSATPN